MWETISPGSDGADLVELDIVQGEDFEQVFTAKDEGGVVIPFVTDGYTAKAAITDRTGKLWTVDMTAVLADDGTITVGLVRAKTVLLTAGTHLWTLVLIEPDTGYYNPIFNVACRVHAGAVKS